ncbi:hypothetical protein AAFH96_37435, partial [Polymorphospora sp. 2-325]
EATGPVAAITRTTVAVAATEAAAVAALAAAVAGSAPGVTIVAVAATLATRVAAPVPVTSVRRTVAPRRRPVTATIGSLVVATRAVAALRS